ncbi:MAG: hypothetical protein ACJ0FQ_00155 [Gammaproteobacteria bacterium]
MIFKKFYYKLINQNKYVSLKFQENEKKLLKIFKFELEEKINKINQNLKKEEISFLHSGHLGDIINALPVIKELSKNHKCNLYIQAEKKLEIDALGYKNRDDKYYLSKKMCSMLLPLLKEQNFINNIELYSNQNIDIDLDLFRKIPMNFNLDSVRWYFLLTGIEFDLREKYLNVEDHPSLKDKIVIMRSTRRRNPFINYKFINNYKDVFFIGLRDEYDELKKEISNLEFYNSKNFLELAQIIKSSRFFLGNASFGFAIAEALKVPRLLESYPDFPAIYPNGGMFHNFYFQVHFEEFFKKLNKSN